VINSCRTDEQKKNPWKGWMLVYNSWIILVNVLFWGLMISVFWMPTCEKTVYPWNFIALSALILSIQLFCLFLWSFNYFIDFDSMPEISMNRLHFNPMMTKHQLKVLQITFAVFGFLTLGTVAMGSHLANSMNDESKKVWLSCSEFKSYETDEWGTDSLLGNLFISLHQMLILL